MRSFPKDPDSIGSVMNAGGKEVGFSCEPLSMVQKDGINGVAADLEERYAHAHQSVTAQTRSRRRVQISLGEESLQDEYQIT
jgi:hypothetical protein